jgi:hypothetical protein
MRIRGRLRKRWIVDIEDGNKTAERNVKKKQNGRESRESVGRLKPTLGCNASKRRRRNAAGALTNH